MDKTAVFCYPLMFVKDLFFPKDVSLKTIISEGLYWYLCSKNTRETWRLSTLYTMCRLKAVTKISLIDYIADMVV